MLNTILIGIVTVAVAVVWPLAALAVLLGGLLLVYLRGYVVPYTPQFAPWLVERLPIDVGFSHGYGTDPDSDSLADDLDSPAPDAVLEELFRAGVLEGDDELHLSEPFETDWEDRMEELAAASESELLERAGEAARGDIEAQSHNGRILLAGDRDVWLSRPVAIAETAAVETLAERGIDPDVRTAAARPLRLFLDRCPDCGGPAAETTISRCCGGPGSTQRRPGREVLACESCEAVLFDFERLPE
ncbi:hypothetical protein AArcSl_0981 [Halalkaliarchaeum desulfuricum]|uniref:Uncharacterized protein n=1 Tax=Halalkaliarchaeum desulfuricum TaxID=2055893 RepID=A0A343THP7_9EURY|nr:hypothetical protein AArcSl_0981 [Halalkaliarchaeum desulfuricum]